MRSVHVVCWKGRGCWYGTRSKQQFLRGRDVRAFGCWGGACRARLHICGVGGRETWEGQGGGEDWRRWACRFLEQEGVRSKGVD